MSDTPPPINLEEEKFMRRARAFALHMFQTTAIPSLQSNPYKGETRVLSKDALHALFLDQLETVYLWKGGRDVVRDFEGMMSDAINAFQTQLLDRHRIALSYTEKRALDLFCQNIRASLTDYLRIEQRERTNAEAAAAREGRGVAGVQNDNAGNVVNIDFTKGKRPR